MKSTMRPIHSLIEEKIYTRAQNIQSLSLSVRSRLSSDLKQHCWVVEVIDNTLILVTDSAERATILRYQQHELLKQINEDFSRTLARPVRRIKIKVDYKLDRLNTVKTTIRLRTKEEIGTAKNYCNQMLNLLD